MTVELRFENTTETFDDDEIISVNPVLTHTGVADFQMTIRGDRALEEFAKRQERTHIAFNGTVQWTGYITNCSHSLSSGNTRISGEGIAKRLKETRPDYESLDGGLTYSNISVQEALKDYWPRTPFNATVTDQPEELVSGSELIQSADTQSEWESEFPTQQDADVWKIENGFLTLKPVTFFFEGENPTTENLTNRVQDGSLSNGDSIEVLDTATYEFTPEHDIPAEEVGVGFRDAIQTETVGATEIIVNGTVVDTIPDGLDAQTFNPTWRSPGFYDLNGSYADRGGTDLQANTTYTIEISGPGGEPDYIIDALSVYDKRYISQSNHTETITNGYLDGPELFPDSLQIESEIQLVGFNIASSDIQATINNLANNQALSLSNDGGNTYTTFNNTDVGSVGYSSAGRAARVRFTLGRTDDVRNTATPRTGYNAQAVDSFEHRVDLTDLAVIDELELSKNHFDNLQDLHRAGEFVWVIDHSDNSISNLTVESFKRGEKTKTLPTEKEIESTPEIAADNYYNSIYLQGALQDDGTRPTAERKDQTRISNDGREISPGVLRDLDITTDSGAVFKANTLLERAKTNNALRGQKVFPARFDILPGYAYPVNFGNGNQEFTLEEINLSLRGDTAEVTLDFVPPRGLSQDISDLRRNAQQQSDRV